MERLTYVTGQGEVLFQTEDLSEDEGATIVQLAKNERFEELEVIAERLANHEKAAEIYMKELAAAKEDIKQLLSEEHVPCEFCRYEAQMDAPCTQGDKKWCRQNAVWKGTTSGLDEIKDKDSVIEQLKKAAYEKFGNIGMGGELIVNLDDAIAIIGGETEKKKKWCNTCHVQNDCEDKEKFLKSDDGVCFIHA